MPFLSSEVYPTSHRPLLAREPAPACFFVISPGWAPCGGSFASTLALKGGLRPRRAPGARCPHTRAKHTLQSPTYLQGWTIAAYLPPFHKHNGHAGFRGQFGQCSLEAPPVLCGTEAEKGAGQASRPRREVRGGGGACAAPTARPQATRSPPARRRDSATCLSPGRDLGPRARPASDPGPGRRAQKLETWPRGRLLRPEFRSDSDSNHRQVTLNLNDLLSQYFPSKSGIQESLKRET